MDQYQNSLDGVFQALADPTRRSVLARLGREAASISELAQPFAMALPSFMKHIKMLEKTGLIRTRKTGRVRRCEVAEQQLELVSGWLAGQRSIWEARTDRLEALVVNSQKEQST